MLAEPVDAARALSLGLLTSVVADEELPGAAAALAARLAAGPTLAYAAIKESLAYAASTGCPRRWPRRPTCRSRLGQTRDHRAATQAFLRKEKPGLRGPLSRLTRPRS